MGGKNRTSFQRGQARAKSAGRTGGQASGAVRRSSDLHALRQGEKLAAAARKEQRQNAAAEREADKRAKADAKREEKERKERQRQLAEQRRREQAAREEELQKRQAAAAAEKTTFLERVGTASKELRRLASESAAVALVWEEEGLVGAFPVTKNCFEESKRGQVDQHGEWLGWRPDILVLQPASPGVSFSEAARQGRTFTADIVDATCFQEPSDSAKTFKNLAVSEPCRKRKVRRYQWALGAEKVVATRELGKIRVVCKTVRTIQFGWARDGRPLALSHVDGNLDTVKWEDSAALSFRKRFVELLVPARAP